MVARLCDRNPVISPDALVDEMVPPSTFDHVSFDSYIPDPNEPSQAQAVAKARDFVACASKLRGKKKGFFLQAQANRSTVSGSTSTAVSASARPTCWHRSITRCPPPNRSPPSSRSPMWSALGFTNAVERLADHTVLCIDEFELDDPGDTMLVASADRTFGTGVSIVATSNTLPGQLGEGRFAAQDFLREIRKLSGDLRDDPRRRTRLSAPRSAACTGTEGRGRTDSRSAKHARRHLDDFDDLCKHLATLHPSKYKALVDGVSLVHRRGAPGSRQTVALRIVVLADRLYDADIPVTVAGSKLDEIFTEEMINGGYRKKHLRAPPHVCSLCHASPNPGVSPPGSSDQTTAGPAVCRACSRGRSWCAILGLNQ